MKSLIQFISESKNTQSSIENLVSDDFLESSLRELPLKASSDQDIQKWLSILEDSASTSKSTAATQATVAREPKLNFAIISQVAAAIVIGVGLAVLMPELSNQTSDYATSNSLTSADTSTDNSKAISRTTNRNIQLTDATTHLTPEDIALAQTWVQESVQTQSAGIYQAADGKLYHAVEFNYLELPTNRGATEAKLQRKTQYIFIPVEETH